MPPGLLCSSAAGDVTDIKITPIGEKGALLPNEPEDFGDESEEDASKDDVEEDGNTATEENTCDTDEGELSTEIEDSCPGDILQDLTIEDDEPEPEPAAAQTVTRREDGFVGCSNGDSTGISMQRKVITAKDGSATAQFFAANSTYLPVHMKLEVEGAAASVKLVPANTAGFQMAAVAAPSADDARRLDYTWSFGWGDPDAKHNDKVRYSLPFSGRPRHVCQAFGGKYSHQGKLHYSVDFDMPVGQQVRACRAGVVVAVKDDSDEGGASRKYAGKGNYVNVLHKDGTVGTYMHFLKASVLCKVGGQIKRGQLLGFIGMTGFTSRPHVHFHVKLHGDFFQGKEWTTVPFMFKAAPAGGGTGGGGGGGRAGRGGGIKVKAGCWYDNRQGAAVLVRAPRRAAPARAGS